MALKYASSMGEVHAMGADDAQLTRYWDSQSGLGLGQSAGLRSNIVMTDNIAIIKTPTFTQQNTWIIQLAFKGSGNLTSGTTDFGIRFLRQGAEQFRLMGVPYNGRTLGVTGEPDGERYSLQVKRGSTVVDTSDPDYYTKMWTLVQIKVTIDTGVGGAYEVKAIRTSGDHGLFIGSLTTAISGSSVNTADQGVAGCDQIELSWGVGVGTMSLDHLVVFDSTGTVNNDFPGAPLFVQGVIPNANGVQNDWVEQGGGGSGFDKLNDPAASISDDDGRLTSDMNGDLFLVAFQIPGETGTPGNETGHPIGFSSNVIGLIFHHVSGMENSGNRTVSPIYRNILNVRADGTNQVLNSTQFNGFFEVFENNPVSASAWTAQETREMQWGIKVQA